jgi:3-methyladenine DNA glycosylase/8-oxoguanine DNA glycosylase
MFSKRLSLDTPRFYDLYATCHAHGWKNLLPFHWDDDNKLLQFTAYVAEMPVDFEASQSNACVIVTLRSAKSLSVQQIEAARSLVTRSLCLNIDTAPLLEISKKVGPEYVRLIKMGAGRLLRAPTLWEDAAKTLFTTNCTWSLTTKMCESFCSDVFSKAAPSGVYPFPTAEKIARYSPKALNKVSPVGYRSEYLIGLAKHFTKDPLLGSIESNGLDYEVADAVVRKIKGFGDYATAHMLILAGYYDKVPIDTVVVAYLKENHRVRKPQSFIDRHYRKWGKYKWWGLKLENYLTTS